MKYLHCIYHISEAVNIFVAIALFLNGYLINFISLLPSSIYLIVECKSDYHKMGNIHVNYVKLLFRVILAVQAVIAWQTRVFFSQSITSLPNLSRINSLKDVQNPPDSLIRNVENTLLKPKSFDILDLPFPQNHVVSWVENMIDISTIKSDQLSNVNYFLGEKLLCCASFALDISAIKFLLFDLGISPIGFLN